MRIVNRQTFLALPPNTVFSTYEPCVFGPIAIKGNTIRADDGRAIDFFYQITEDTWAIDNDYDWLIHAQETGESISADLDCQSREGLFDDSMLYAVWEKTDVRQLVDRLTLCL